MSTEFLLSLSANHDIEWSFCKRCFLGASAMDRVREAIVVMTSAFLSHRRTRIEKALDRARKSRSMIASVRCDFEMIGRPRLFLFRIFFPSRAAMYSRNL